MSASAPVLSVVVPVYNGAEFIEGCLRSVARAALRLTAEQREQVEIIVCDNHSIDGTLALTAHVPVSCAYRAMQPPEHYANRTRNWDCAIRAARGEWVVMLHADDLLAPGALRGILRAAASPGAREAVLLPGRIRVFTDPERLGRLRPLWPFGARLPGRVLRRRVLPFLCPFVPFTPMRRSAYEKVGGLNFAYELVQDLDLWLRLLAEGDAYYTPYELGWWRNHPLSENYARTFAAEHFRFARQLTTLVPELSVAAITRSFQLAHAKATHWLSRAEADRLAAAEQAGSIPFLSDAAVPAFLALQERTAGLFLWWLRGLALLRS